METPDQSGAGYPEEQPEEVTPGSGTHESKPEKGGDPDHAADNAPDNDDGQATGGG